MKNSAWYEVFEIIAIATFVEHWLSNNLIFAAFWPKRLSDES